MKKNKKVSLSKKPFLVLTRRAIFGWLAVIFLVCAWMFIIGVLVGRGTAPIKFDIAKLQKKLEASKGNLENQNQGLTQEGTGFLKDKTKLDFYEVLPQNREDTKIDGKVLTPKVKEKIEPLPKKKSSANITASKPKKKKSQKSEPVKPRKSQQSTKKSNTKTSGKTYTIQAASVKLVSDADRLVASLKKKGYPAYRAIGKIPGKGIWYRVRIGEYSSRADAGRMLQKLKKEGMKPIVVER
jgi:cell division protein FtsN